MGAIDGEEVAVEFFSQCFALAIERRITDERVLDGSKRRKWNLNPL